jgi:putative heme-binding domain-containing protein
MKRLSVIGAVVALAMGFTASAQEFQSLFNGKDLSGWKGKSQFWRVENGTIVGETTADKPTAANTFLVWQGGEVQDFEFSCQVKFAGNNSGVQYRSEIMGDPMDYALRGYQADLHPKQEFFGMLYGEKYGKRGIIARRGQRANAKGDKDVEVLGKVGDGAELKGDEWNTLRILVVGNRLKHFVNGVITVDVTESHPQAMAKGHLGLQLHRGAPMKVEFKDLKLRKLAAKPTKKAAAPTSKAAAAFSATAPDRINLPDGFKIELLYSVPRDTQGSWGAMCKDDKGRLIASDQYGGIYRFPVPAPGKTIKASDVEQIAYASNSPKPKKRKGKPAPAPKQVDKRTAAQKALPQLGHAQGLCYAFDSLYVVVNSRSSQTGSGVFRLRDTNGDDKFDKMDVIRKLDATGGEHGPHAILPAPDGKHLYVVMGNQTSLPKDYSHSRVPELWGEDQLLKPIEHFMVGARAPLGHVAQIDPEGKTWDVVATGFRNQYDVDINQDGELFTYDADMEWDLNTPWYRPTRVNHIIDGADYGWRTGSAKFMDYCSDTFGAVADIGPGSPTGVAFGHGAKFPAKYQNAFFISDWSYGKLYAVHMTPKGSTYTATVEEFASAQPLPLTDLLVHPDGAMYLAVGGRGVQSGVYRLTYEGDESTAPAKPVAGGEAARKQRKALEAFLQVGAKPATGKQLDSIWAALGSKDRGIRHAGRVALEKQPVSAWKARATAEKDPQTALAALIALARADKGSAPAVLTKAMTFDYASLKKQQRLDQLRVMTLALARGGQPPKPLANKLVGWLDKVYPARTPEENRDLSALVAFLQAPYAAKKGMALLVEASGQEEQIGYALNLRLLNNGWTPELRKQYFEWYVLAGGYSGGARFKNYLADIKKQAVASVPKAEMTKELQAVINKQSKATGPQFSLKPRKFVKNYTSKDLNALVGKDLEPGRDFKNGRQMFGAGSCYACHRFNNEGGAVGPDLSSVRGKFSARDLLEAIVDPAKEISDQYGASVFKTKDGKELTGRIMNMRDPDYWINTDMMTPSTVTKIKIADITSIEPSPISMMPPGLINTMTKDDIQDLLAYLISGGDPTHKMYAK